MAMDGAHSGSVRSCGVLVIRPGGSGAWVREGVCMSTSGRRSWGAQTQTSRNDSVSPSVCRGVHECRALAPHGYRWRLRDSLSTIAALHKAG